MRRHGDGYRLALVLVLGMMCGGCKGGTDDGGSVAGEKKADGSSTFPASGAGSDSGKEAGAQERIYWNQVAGRFYPGDAGELDEAVTGYIGGASPPPASVKERDLLGFISPHAGYPYSGPVAGYGYRLLQGRKVTTAVVLGFSHSRSSQVSSVLDFDAYRTPLGPIPIDRDLVAQLLERGKDVLDTSQTLFAQEHSLETQLPFLARAVPSIRVVPIMVGRPSGKVDTALADLLHDVIGQRDDVVVIASTDLSHDLSHAEATSQDGETLERIASGDWSGFAAEGPSSGRMCGYYTVGVLMHLASLYDDSQGHVIHYANSGDVMGDPSSRIVGYGVVAFTLPEGVRTVSGSDHKVPEAPVLAGDLSRSDVDDLIRIALEAARAAARGEGYAPVKPSSETLGQSAAVLVQVLVRGRLQGAAGSLSAGEPLYRAVAEAAMDAVASDPRYPSPGAEDLDEIQCRIIVVRSSWPLDTPEATASFKEAAGEKHGLHVVAGDREAFVHADEDPRGVWDASDLFSQACRRVALSPTCHRPTKQDRNEVEPVFTAFTGEFLVDAGKAGE